ncbi:MAG: DUF4860 domain-containing protein [Clostridiales bacterium]|nr:DUF4860 domain-containing protein [Clostridiales bacterium]
MFGRKSHSMNLVFVILLLGVFAIAAVFTAVLGAKIYESGTQKMQDNFDMRTSVIYLSEKIRTAGSAGDISTRDLPGIGKALVISETVNGQGFESWIFVADGQLCESVVAAGDTPLPGAAQQIMPLTSFQVTKESGGVSLTVVTAPGASGSPQTISTFLAERTGS